MNKKASQDKTRERGGGGEGGEKVESILRGEGLDKREAYEQESFTRQN